MEAWAPFGEGRNELFENEVLVNIVKKKTDEKIINKKVMSGIIVVVLFIIFRVGIYFWFHNNDKTNGTEKTSFNYSTVNENSEMKKDLHLIKKYL